MDERIIAALTEPPPPDGAPGPVVAMYDKLIAKLAEYDECVAGTRSAEGLSLSMSIQAAAEQVANYHAAYRRLLDKQPLAEGAKPHLLKPQMGHCVDFSNGQLHRL